MKAIELYSSKGTHVGKLWVRPAQEGFHVGEKGGLIEILLDLIPTDGKLHCKAPVDCRLFKEEIKPHKLFHSEDDAYCFIDGYKTARRANGFESDPDWAAVKLGSKWAVYLP